MHGLVVKIPIVLTANLHGGIDYMIRPANGLSSPLQIIGFFG
jgi:hypothetical protein